jgi:hypothetical protein
VQNPVSIERQIENDRVARGSVAEPLNAKFADFDILQRILVLALIDVHIDALLIVVHIRALSKSETVRLAISDTRNPQP